MDHREVGRRVVAQLMVNCVARGRAFFPELYSVACQGARVSGMPRKAGWLSEGAPVYAVDASYPLDIASSFILLIKIPDLLIFSVFFGFLFA